MITIPDRQLTPNFKLSELCHTEEDLDNTPPPAMIPVLEELAEFLEKVRTRALGGNPVSINSGYRSPAVNEAVGGEPTSAHALGRAADIECPAFGDPYAVSLAIKAAIERGDLAVDQLIYEVTWTHVARVGANGELRATNNEPNGYLTHPESGGYLDGLIAA